MNAPSPHTNSHQAWQQLLNLLAGRPWSFSAENWLPLCRLARWHHVLVELHTELAAQPDNHDFDTNQLELLHAQSLAERRHLLMLSQVQQQLCQQLQAAGIRALFFKGVVLGQWLSGSNTVRQCRDVDLIVHPRDFEHACEVLRKLDCFRLIPRESVSDFAMTRYRHAMKDVSMVHRPSGGLIELHWALRPFNQAFAFDFDNAWARRRSIQVDDYALPTFDDSLHTRYLAAHGCNSHWGRLRWLLDWHQLAQLPLDWPTIVADCQSVRERAHLKNAFSLANRQLDTAIPPAIAALPRPRAAEFMLGTQAKYQALGRYPGWLQRQLLNFCCQQDLPGACGYLLHMGKKALAADTLHPGMP